MGVLVDATARVLVDRGWAGTTTNHIAQRAGVSVGTLYEYFPSKEALATVLVQRHLDEAESRLAALAAWLADATPTLEQVVSLIVSAMIELHAAGPRLHRVLFEEVPQSPALRQRVRLMEESHAKALATLLPRFVTLTEPETTARVVVELLEALTHRWIVGSNGGPLPRARMQAELERLILAYLRA